MWREQLPQEGNLGWPSPCWRHTSSPSFRLSRDPVTSTGPVKGAEYAPAALPGYGARRAQAREALAAATETAPERIATLLEQGLP